MGKSAVGRDRKGPLPATNATKTWEVLLLPFQMNSNKIGNTDHDNYFNNNGAEISTRNW